MSDVHRVVCANGNCGSFPMDNALYRKLQRTGETFHCPEGHAQHFTESKEKRIQELERKLERYKERSEKRKEQTHDQWERHQEEKQRRKFAESRLLDYAKGVVEVGSDQFRWSCECDSRGQKVFDDVEAAKDAFGEHRRRRCTVENHDEITVNTE